MALAGAEANFQPIDETPKSIMATSHWSMPNGRRSASWNKERTGTWAETSHEDGTITYTEVTGDVRFEDVDFGYVDNQLVLHDINL